MITKFRFNLCAACLPVMLGVLSQPADAGVPGHCKMAVVAEFPVVMEGSRISVRVSFNGKQSRLWLDSGAFYNFMPEAKAVELELPLEHLPSEYSVSGIGGSFTPQLARVRDFGIVGATLHNMEFIVGGSDSGNGFLGANFLGVFDTEFDLTKGAVNLFRESGCNGMNVAYWSAGMAVGEAHLFSGEREDDHHIYVEVMVNNHSLRAVLDSGAMTSIIGRHAAERAGIDLKAPQVVASANVGGLGSQLRRSWIARTQTISIGGEVIRNSPIRVIDDLGDDRGHDMLLGVDFLMSHHVLVSQPQRKMFLTYNGGPIFSASTDGEIGHQITRAEDMGAAEKATVPKTADDFAGRASARLNRGDATGSIADYTDAIHLAPGAAELLADRAGAYMRGGHPELAVNDIEAALVIAPKDHRLLIVRAKIRLAKGDQAGTLADTEAAAAATPTGSLDVMSVVRLYEQMGMADRGLPLIDRVVELHRDDSRYAALLNARSWNRGLANSDLDRALKDVSTAIRISGPTPEMLDTRALVQLRRKDYAAAIADENAALGKMPKMAAALFTRALARLANGDTAGGNADIAAAREIRPKIAQYYALYRLSAPDAGMPDATKSLAVRTIQPDLADDEDKGE